MTYFEKISAAQKKNDSLLCVGLDPNPDMMPSFLKVKDEYVFGFNKAIIDATIDLVCAYKPNLAFYMAMGLGGLRCLKRTIDYIPEHIPVILDCKLGDVRHSSAAYAKSIFEEFDADACTVSPYVGIESIQPFFDYSEKGVYVLGLTSNPGYKDFQALEFENKTLFQHVAQQIDKTWQQTANVGLVVGATHPDQAEMVRESAPSIPFLIPGVGAQGGNLARSVEIGKTSHGLNPVIVSSRSIIYASSDLDFADKARQKAIETKITINEARNYDRKKQ